MMLRCLYLSEMFMSASKNNQFDKKISKLEMAFWIVLALGVLELADIITSFISR